MPKHTKPDPAEVPEPLPAANAEDVDTQPAKKVRKRLKDGEKILAKELAKYKEVAKKAKHDLGSQALIEDREKVKKAEWMHDSIKHYLKDGIKKNGKSASDSLDDNFHQSVEESLADLKTARKRIKGLLAP